MPDTLSIIIPTKNEQESISSIIYAIRRCVSVPKTIIVVDDSTDNTPKIATKLGCQVIQGQGKGLGQAIIDGIKASQSEIVLVMDADGSHRPEDIEKLISPLIKDGYDMVIGSRYIKGGQCVDWELSRRIISRLACLIAYPITFLNDNTSGFFSFRKSILKDVSLEASSWKTMLEVLLKAKPARVLEVPISFEPRLSGKSKFNQKQTIAYLQHLIKLALWKHQKFLKFCIVGGIGALITFSLTWILTEEFKLWYMASLLLAVVVATISNYTLNTIWTFKVALDPSEPDYEWNSFYKGSFIQKWWKQSIAKTVWEWMPNASSLLDIGCGSSPIITGYNGEDIYGIDRNQSKLDFMKTKCPRHKFLNTSTLHFTKEQFDHVLCIEVLEHLSNPEETIKEIARVVKDGGQVILATPDYSKKLWEIAEKFTPYKEEHIYKFTRQTLVEMCLKYNLVPKRYSYIAGCDLIHEFIKNDYLRVATEITINVIKSVL